MALNYTLKENRTVEAKVTFLRVVPNGKRQTLADIYSKFQDQSWIKPLTPSSIQDSYRVRVNRTLEKIVKIIEDSQAIVGMDAVVTDAAEYIVSVLAREAVIKELSHKEVPLPELFKQQSSQNPGFDFFTINQSEVLLFGEAKYVNGSNAYGRALKQISEFIDIKNDIADMADLVVLVRNDILDKVGKGTKGYIAAFSSIATASDRIISGIKSNDDFAKIKKYDELILVAVDML